MSTIGRSNTRLGYARHRAIAGKVQTDRQSANLNFMISGGTKDVSLSQVLDTSLPIDATYRNMDSRDRFLIIPNSKTARERVTHVSRCSIISSYYNSTGLCGSYDERDHNDNAFDCNAATGF
jgi:hypothetical protein